jgi:hypothetical protein
MSDAIIDAAIARRRLPRAVSPRHFRRHAELFFLP